MIRTYFNFYLGLPENIYFPVKDGSEQAFVSTSTISGDSMFAFNQNDYNWLNKSSDREIHRILATSNRDQITIPIKYIYNYKDKDMFSGGIVKLSRYTIFNVIFNVSETFATPTSKQIEIYKEKAKKILQKFINAYRWVSLENDIYKPDSDDMTVIEFLYSDQEIFVPGNEYIDFKVVSKGFNWSDVSKTPPSKKKMDNSTLEMFNKQLKLDHNLSLYQELLLDAKQQAHFNNNYELAILKIATSIEVFLHQALMQLAEQNGQLKLPIGKSKKAENMVLIDYKEAIQKGNIREQLLGTYFKEITGKSLKGTKVYNEWYECAYTLRNNIIHKGKSNITETEVRKALDSTVALINKILTFIK